MLRVNAQQLLAMNERGLSFDARNMSWNQYDGDITAVKITEDSVHLWIFTVGGNVYEESSELSDKGWDIKGWEKED